MVKSVGLRSIAANTAGAGDGIPAERFQVLKDDAVKVLHSICQQIWKTQQWPQDWKRSVFIPVPKKGNAKECQTTAQLHSFHVLVRLCSKSFKLGFNSLWTKSFHMNRLGLEKAEESETKLPISTGSLRKQGNSRKTSASLTALKPLTADHDKLWKILKDGNTRPPYLSTEKPVCRIRSNS